MKQQGFSIFELLLVLALIGVIAAVILPNLQLNFESQLSISIKNLVSQIRATYDRAILSGRWQRIVLNLPEGEFWTEEAPTNYRGRATASRQNLTLENNKKEFLKILTMEEQSAAKRKSPYSSAENPLYYSIRSIPVVQKNILSSTKWLTLQDSNFTKKKLPAKIVFLQFSSNLDNNIYIYSNNNIKYAYIYFLPNGSSTAASIKLGSLKPENKINTDNNVTLTLNTLTGEVKIHRD